VNTPPAAPPAPAHARLGPEAVARHFERYGAVLVTRNRLFVLTLVQALALALLAWATLARPPTVRYRPYVVVARPSGRTTLVPARPARRVHAVVLRYFLARWAVHLLTLDTGLTRRDLTRDYRLVRGAAVGEFRAWAVRTEPLARLTQHPALVRAVHLRALTLLPHGVAVLRLRTVTRSGRSGRPRRKSWLLTLNYTFARPRHRRTLLFDPLGLYVTNFTLEKTL
jgi:type IV secretory pathway TrbF-like protein